MAYDQALAERIQDVLGDLEGLEEKRMFGGVGYLVHGNMACGVHKEALIVRVGPGAYEEALARPHAGVFDMTGRPMTGWVMVDPEGLEADQELRAWVQQGVDFAMTLPRK